MGKYLNPVEGADEAEGGEGAEPNGPGHQRRYGDPQPCRFAVPAHQPLATKAPVRAVRRTNRISNTNCIARVKESLAGKELGDDRLWNGTERLTCAWSC